MPQIGEIRLGKWTVANLILLPLFYMVLYYLFAYSYREYISEQYAYLGFEYIDDPDRFLVGIVTTLAFSVFFAFVNRKASHLFLNLHFVFPILPATILYSVGNGPEPYFVASISFFALICMLVVIPIRLPTLSMVPMETLMWVLMVFCALYIVAIISLGGLRFVNLDILAVYEFRRDAADNLPGIFGYLSPIVTKAVIPVAFAIAIYKKHWISVGLLTATSVFIFAVTSSKMPLFVPFAIAGFYFLISRPWRMIAIVLAHMLVVAVSLFSPLVGDQDRLFGAFTLRRVYFIPALIDNKYFEFFSVNAFVRWADSRITFGLIQNPYDLSPPRIIGSNYFLAETHANTGWLGSGYSNLGYWGMFIYALIIAFLIKYTDSIARKTDIGFASAVFMIPFLTLFTSTDLPAMFLTHGLLFLLVLVTIFKKESR